MIYRYSAINQNNKKQSGEIQAADQSEALNQLKEQGLLPLTLLPLTKDKINETEEQSKYFWQRELGNQDIHERKVSKKKILSIANQMSILIKSGVDLATCMTIILDTEKDKTLKKIMNEVNEDLLSGLNLATSMKKFKAFPEIMTNILAAGEFNGQLDQGFARSAKVLEQEIAMNSKIRGALVYPLMLAAVTLVVLIVLNSVVLPTFVSMFDQYGADLPTITRIVIEISTVFSRFWWLFGTIMVLIVVFYQRHIRKNQEFALKVARRRLAIPIIGKVIRQVYIARFCRVMASLEMAGVEVLRALTLARDVVPNAYLRDHIDRIIEGVQIGIPINQTMEKSKVFDVLLISMIRAGEESGQLGETLEKLAEMYETQSDTAITGITRLVEPTMTIVMAIIVGIVIISIVLPMFGIYNIVG